MGPKTESDPTQLAAEAQTEAAEIKEEIKEAEAEATEARKEGDTERADRLEAEVKGLRGDLGKVIEKLDTLVGRPFHPAPEADPVPPAAPAAEEAKPEGAATEETTPTGRRMSKRFFGDRA
jgi:hypothetical protein